MARTSNGENKYVYSDPDFQEFDMLKDAVDSENAIREPRSSPDDRRQFPTIAPYPRRPCTGKYQIRKRESGRNSRDRRSAKHAAETSADATQ